MKPAASHASCPLSHRMLCCTALDLPFSNRIRAFCRKVVSLYNRFTTQPTVTFFLGSPTGAEVVCAEDGPGEAQLAADCHSLYLAMGSDDLESHDSDLLVYADRNAPDVH